MVTRRSKPSQPFLVSATTWKATNDHLSASGRRIGVRSTLADSGRCGGPDQHH